ncbi:MAG: ATP-dependent zinc metalloprotease FtsH [Bacteroidetes bacterium]|nr:ATP-dependent zinc metalloprotease FtsH [Bacteroidota bacterium]
MSKDTPKKENNPQAPGKGPRVSIWIYLAILLILLSIHSLFSIPDSADRIEYSTFLNHVRSGHVEEVTVVNGVEIRGNFKQSAVESGQVSVPERPASNWTNTPAEPILRFTTTKFEGDDIRPILEEFDVKYDAKIEENWFSGIFTWLLFLLVLVAFWIFIFRRMNPGQQVLNIGKNKAMLYDKSSENKVTFKDVAGLQEAKEEVEEVVAFLKSPEKFTKLGGKIPKGVLLVGPPGTGKTLMAKATAGEADVPFFSLSGSDFVEMFVGVGAARVRDLFKQAKEKAPCIIFIDEIDAIGRSRGKNATTGSNDERENTLNQLLAEMDGFGTEKGVIMMAATNRPDILDSALLRPGRFDRQILIDKPDLNGRLEVLNVHLQKIKKSDDLDVKLLATQTPGFAGAELANMCNEAALLAARRNKEFVEMIDFQDAIERVVAGLEKKNKIISPREREIVAYHESGHAIVGWYLEHTDPVMKVSIVPRGLAALGYTLQTPLEDRFLMTREELMDKICALLGGRVAEDIIFGKVSTGAQNDLERITNMAFAMVAVYGMSEELGNISYYDSGNPDGSFGFNKKYSESTSQRIDETIRKVIDDCYKRTKDLLTEHQDKLEQMAKTLLKKEILTGADLIDMLGERPYGNYPISKEDVDKIREIRQTEIEEKERIEAEKKIIAEISSNDEGNVSVSLESDGDASTATDETKDTNDAPENSSEDTSDRENEGKSNEDEKKTNS